MPSHRNKIDIVLPSTSHDHKVYADTEQCFSSSPTVRVAKRNAQLLNGRIGVTITFLVVFLEIDLISGKKKAAFAESIMSIVPDFEVPELDEKCSVIQRILNANAITAEDLVRKGKSLAWLTVITPERAATASRRADYDKHRQSEAFTR